MKFLARGDEMRQDGNTCRAAKDASEMHEPGERGYVRSTFESTRFKRFEDYTADHPDIRAGKACG
jgi:hypothetical protein